MPEIEVAPVDDWEPPEATGGSRARRTVPSTWGGVFYLGLLAVVGFGLYLAAQPNNWRAGVFTIAGCLLTAASARVVVPQRHVGMLAVRHWLLDVFVLSTAAVVLIVLALSIPDQPGP